jgi:hypothetical protein
MYTYVYVHVFCEMIFKKIFVVILILTYTYVYVHAFCDLLSEIQVSERYIAETDNL